MKKFFLILLSAVVAVFLVLVCVWNPEIRTMASVKSVDGNEYLYQMEYKANYDLDELMEADITSNAELLKYVVGRITKGLPINLVKDEDMEEASKAGGFACTSFSVKQADGEGYYYGRNYDFYKNPTMVTFSHPKKGYASIGVSDMSHFGYGLDDLPTNFLKKALCLAAVYAPVDGVNEKGLCTSIMAIPKQAAAQNSGHHKVGTSIIMRLWLDRCATVAEALDLLGNVDVNHDQSVGGGYHYMVADAQGDCAIIEFDKEDGWKTMILRKGADSTYMHVTNHLLSDKYRTETPDIRVGNPKSFSWDRYNKVYKYMKEHEGRLTMEQAQECLAQVRWVDLQIGEERPEDTQYSNVYDQTNLTLYLKNWNDYGQTKVFQLSK